MADSSVSNWQVPFAADDEKRKIGWLDSVSEEGLAWLKSQRGYRDFRKALDVISGGTDLKTTDYRSKLNTNPLKRNIREVVGALSKLRPFWGYSSDNKAFSANAEMMNKVARAWYLESFADRSVKEALQYAAATNRGWVRPVYRRDMYGTGRGDISLLTYGSPCVLPFQLPASGDWQAAYAVTILDEMPIAMAHGMFPLYQDRLRPTSSKYWYDADIRRAARGNLISRIFGGGTRSGQDAIRSDLFIPIRYTYVIDLTVNRTGMTIPMGEPGTSWFYEVPSVDQDIPLGNGTFRKATTTDARLYPYRRLLISSESCVMYDGPAFDWHGKLPLCGFSVDQWPWEPLGFSLVHDGYDIQTAITELERGIMDKQRAKLDLALGYDINSVTSKEARQFDPMQPRGRVGFDGSMTDMPFKPIVPPEVYKVDASDLAHLDHLYQKLDSQLMINEVSNLARARALTNSDDLEKLEELIGPVVEDISRSMEPPMRDLGDMVKYLILQYYTASRVMQCVGPDGITMEMFDFEPDSIVPSHLPGENPDHPSPTARITRARTFADNLRFHILPNTLHERMQMTQKLGLIQLRKAGVQISSQTIAESWNVGNFGTLDGNTELEKWRSEQEMMLEFAERAKIIQASLEQAAENPLGTALAQMAASGGAGGPTAGPIVGGSQEGRPPSGHAAPKLVSKNSGERSTITESK